ncbi:methyl-accepting chemotaxis protein [Ectopseudomonas oleovorans]|uniref:cache domain-containing protein n=1 Tax=Ectopseudomonas oleovorans TaxID=301 RepID=UPI00241E3F99|nr:methyl-accepting chemotaxis protein [Pseudomonas oleovorans]
MRSQVESSNALARQIENWLNAKLRLIDLMSQTIDSSYSPEENQRVFDSPLLKSEFILVFGALEADGKPIKNSADWKPSADWDGRKRPWYATGKAGNQAVQTGLYVDSTTNEILISAVARISDAGQFLGVFGGDIRLQSVADAINTLDFNGAGYAFLLSRSGNIISHPNAEYNGKSYSELFDGQSPALSKELHEVEASGKNLLVSFTPLPNLLGMDWYIGVVMAEANRLTWLAVVGTVVGVAISLVVLGLLMNSLLKPLSLLSTSLREINSGEGDLTRRLAITSNDERSAGGLRQAESRMQQSRDTASKTAEDAIAANDMLGRIREAITRINDMNLQIATAAEEQSATTEEINRNTTNIRDISHELAGGAEQQVRQCASMVEQVGQQDRLLGRFKV